MSDLSNFLFFLLSFFRFAVETTVEITFSFYSVAPDRPKPFAEKKPVLMHKDPFI